MSLAIGLIVLSLFVPWWGVIGTTVSGMGILTLESDYGLEFFAPLWSPFRVSALGTKLSSHFLNVLIMLLVSLTLTLFARRSMRTNPRLVPHLLWGAASFSGISVLFFSVFFPRIGYFGHVFWPYGYDEFYGFMSALSLSWFVLPGIFLALGAFILQTHFAIRFRHSTAKESAAEEEKDHSKPENLHRKIAKTPVMTKFVIPVTFVLTAAATWAGASFSPIITAESFQMDWDFDHKSFEPGDRATVVGTVTDLTVIPTSYGDYTFLDIDDEDYVIALEGNRTSQYAIGSWVTIPVHFHSYWYNGHKFTWADEGFAPLPMMFTISMVITAVSYISGVSLFPAESPTGPVLKVLIEHGLPLDAFNVSLVKGGYPYVGEMVGGWNPEGMIDEMVPLRDGSSDNGTVNFVDENDNDLLDLGDFFEFNLPPTADARHIETYLLGIHGPSDGYSIITVRDRGPLMVYLSDWASASPYFLLTMPQDETQGSTCSSRVEVVRTIGPDAHANRYSLRLIVGFTSYENIPAGTSGTTLGSGISLRFEDNGLGGIIDAGDAWVMEGLENGTSYSFRIFDENRGDMVSSIGWACGVGTNIASRPRVTFSEPTADPGNPQRFFTNVSAVDWVPAGLIEDYDVALLKNDQILLPVRGERENMDDLPLGPSEDGQGSYLAFTDTDGNGYLGPGDSFILNNAASQSKYELRIYYNSPDFAVGNITWTT